MSERITARFFPNRYQGGANVDGSWKLYLRDDFGNLPELPFTFSHQQHAELSTQTQLNNSVSCVVAENQDGVIKVVEIFELNKIK